MMKSIYLIRHGETEWNKIRRFQGFNKDIELNEAGRCQARMLQQAMAEISFDRIVASDLIRARETAEILNEPHGLTIELDPKLREMNFGCWEGLNFQQVKEKYPREAEIWLTEPETLKIPGGETFQELFDRVWQRFVFWTQKNDYQNMAIVCHGGTCAALICGVLNAPIENMWQYLQGNTAVNIVEMEVAGQYILKGFNDKSHLENQNECP